MEKEPEYIPAFSGFSCYSWRPINYRHVFSLAWKTKLASYFWFVGVDKTSTPNKPKRRTKLKVICMYTSVQYPFFVSFNSNTTGDTIRAGTAHYCGSPYFLPGFIGFIWLSVFSFFCSVLYMYIIALSPFFCWVLYCLFLYSRLLKIL